MMKTWAALPVLATLAMTGCAALSPAAYQAAAQSLQWRFKSLTPRIELAFPLDQSRLVLDLVMEAENPSPLRLRALGVDGRISLDEHAVGRLKLDRGFDIPAQGKAEVPASLSFTAKELASSWKPLADAIRGKRASLWRIEGEAHLVGMGVDFRLPFRARHHVEPK